jgi:hypothetical protein
MQQLNTTMINNNEITMEHNNETQPFKTTMKQ